MRVLVAHNRYRSDLPSGENVIVEREIELLESAGVEVVPLLVSSDDIAGMTVMQKAGTALGPVVNPVGVAQFARVMRHTEPDIVHVHNLSPLLSPTIIPLAHRLSAPVVATVHNFRRTCVSGNHQLDHRPCFACRDAQLPLAAVRHGCYRDSRLQTVSAALGQVVHRPTWRAVDLTIAPSRFLADRLGRSIGSGRLVVRPHWCPDPGPSGPPGTDVLYVGRLSAEKGLLPLLEAWTGMPRREGTRLRIVGSGPLRAAVERAAPADGSVVLDGQLDRAGVEAALRRAAVVVVPSICDETFNLVAAEALAFGRPLVVSNRGALPEVVDSSCAAVVTPDADGLRAGLTAVLANPQEMSRSARRRYVRHYRPAVGLSSVLDLYRSVLAEGASPARAPRPRRSRSVD